MSVYNVGRLMGKENIKIWNRRTRLFGTDGRLYDSYFDREGKLNAYEYALMDDVVFWTRKNMYYKIFERNNRC